MNNASTFLPYTVSFLLGVNPIVVMKHIPPLDQFPFVPAFTRKIFVSLPRTRIIAHRNNTDDPVIAYSQIHHPQALLANQFNSITKVYSTGTGCAIVFLFNIESDAAPLETLKDVLPMTAAARHLQVNIQECLCDAIIAEIARP